MKIIRAVGVACDQAKHWNVFTNQGEARDWATRQNDAFPLCKPHRIVNMVALDALVRGLQTAMKKHGCQPKCDVCRWAAHVIGALWKT